MKQITVILPSLNPDDKMPRVIEGLLQEGFTDIVLVNDGSDADHLVYFEKAAQHPEVTVLTHEVNKGKGRGLKTAFAYVAENRPDSIGVVTVDGDGQHTPSDIRACAEKMKENGKVVLGCRDFSGKDVPFRSRFGNNSTSLVFRLFCGIKISDTQTGLRAIPAAYLQELCGVKGERFEYETEMLLYFKQTGIPFEEVQIQTVYLEENASSHFRPIRDSLKIYRIILAFMMSSVISFLVDYGIFTVMAFLLDSLLSKKWKLFFATYFARAVSSIVNYTLNKKTVFRNDAPVKKSLIRYYILCIVQVCLSYGIVFLISSVLNAGTWGEILIKPIVDIILFLLSFRIQQTWVFRNVKNRVQA